MRTPPKLKTGDTVAIVAPAKKVTQDELLPAKDVLNQWGFKVVFGDTIGAESHQFAGTDELRWQDVQYMLDNTAIKAIFCARGGYGTVRIIDRLSFENFLQNPKWICGFSDVTVFHSHINKIFNIETLHSVMPVSFEGTDRTSLSSLKNALMGKKMSYETGGSKYNCSGKCKGKITGGNLSILFSLLGSTSQVNTKGKILFLEDLDEYLYHIDRMMMALKRAGMLHELAGLLIGSLNKMHDNDIPFGKNAMEIIASHTTDYNYPVAFNFPAGHVKDNRTLIMGRMYEMTVKEHHTRLKTL